MRMNLRACWLVRVSVGGGSEGGMNFFPRGFFRQSWEYKESPWRNYNKDSLLGLAWGASWGRDFNEVDYECIKTAPGAEAWGGP